MLSNKYFNLPHRDAAVGSGMHGHRFIQLQSHTENDSEICLRVSH